MFKFINFLCFCTLFFCAVSCNREETATPPTEQNTGWAMPLSLGLDTAKMRNGAEPVPDTTNATVERAGCPNGTCPNIFTLAFVPYNKSTCTCWEAYVNHAAPTGPNNTYLTKSASGMGSWYSVAGNLCVGTDIVLCFSRHGGELAGCVNDPEKCFAGMFYLWVSSPGTAPTRYDYPVCFDDSSFNEYCVTLGTTGCCQPGTTSCSFTPNTSWGANLPDECDPCPQGYKCD